MLDRLGAYVAQVIILGAFPAFVLFMMIVRDRAERRQRNDRGRGFTVIQHDER